jgi:membrane protein
MSLQNPAPRGKKLALFNLSSDLLNSFKQAFLSFARSDSGNLSAAIAFYSLLSLFPLVLCLVSLSGFFIRQTGSEEALIQRATHWLPGGTEIIQENLKSISKNFGRVQLISLLLLWWSASGVFLSMETALNRAWRVPSHRSYWRRHLLALGMSLMCGTLLVLSLGVTAVQQRMAHLARASRGEWGSPALFSPLAHSLFLFTPILFSIITFVLIYWIVPNQPVKLREVIGGALVAAILWEIAKHLFAALLPFFNYRHLYGSLGVAVTFMMWGYVSSLILLFGAEFAAASSSQMHAETPP